MSESNIEHLVDDLATRKARKAENNHGGLATPLKRICKDFPVNCPSSPPTPSRQGSAPQRSRNGCDAEMSPHIQQQDSEAQALASHRPVRDWLEYPGDRSEEAREILYVVRRTSKTPSWTADARSFGKMWGWNIRGSPESLMDNQDQASQVDPTSKRDIGSRDGHALRKSRAFYEENCSSSFAIRDVSADVENRTQTRIGKSANTASQDSTHHQTKNANDRSNSTRTNCVEHAMCGDMAHRNSVSSAELRTLSLCSDVHQDEQLMPFMTLENSRTKSHEAHEGDGLHRRAVQILDADKRADTRNIGGSPKDAIDTCLHPDSPDGRSCLSAADTAYACGESVKATSPAEDSCWMIEHTGHVDVGGIMSGGSGGRNSMTRDNDAGLVDIHEQMMKHPHDARIIQGLRGQFRIVRKLGTGGFANVYQAWDAINGRHVALKVFMSCQDSMKQCMTEATHLREYGGEQYNIVYPVDSPPAAPRGGFFLGAGDVSALCLPFVEHDEPHKSICEGLRLNDIRAYFWNLFVALQRLHDHGVLHRDVKPGNYLFNKQTGKGFLIDFGLAERRCSNGRLLSHCSRSSSSAHAQKHDVLESSTPSGHTISGDSASQEAGSKRKRSAVGGEEGHAASAAINKMPPPRDIGTVRVPHIAVQTHALHKQGAATRHAISGGHAQSQEVRRAPDGWRRKEGRANQAGTKGWRAPEVLMQSLVQTTAIDMWSVGVIMLSLLSRKYPFFESPDNETNLLEICSLRQHVASMDDIRDARGIKTGRKENKIKLLSDDYGLELRIGDAIESFEANARALNLTWKTYLEQVCKVCGVECCHLRELGLDEAHPVWDLLDRLLDIDPRTRITARQALQHPFFHEFVPLSLP